MDQSLHLWDLERHGGDLYWGGCSLPELALNYGTPAYIVNADLLKQCYDELLGCFQNEGFSTRLFYSYKTNPIPRVLKNLAALGCGAEVISEFEFWLAMQLGLRGDCIIVNGCHKTKQLLRQAISSNAALINVESLDDLLLVQAIASEVSKEVRIGMRINPCLPKRSFDFTLFAGTRGNPAGFRPAEQEWKQALQVLRKDPLLHVRGLQFHIGSGIRDSRPYINALTTALEMWTDLLHAGFHPTVLDMGGGFGIPALHGLNLMEAVRFFVWNRPPKLRQASKRNGLITEIAQNSSRILQRYARDKGVPVPDVYLEPGRALTGPSQLLLLQVKSLRRRPGGNATAICDAGAMSLSLLLLAEQHRIIRVSGNPDGPNKTYNLVGNLPAPLDLVGLRQQLPVLSPGDVLAVMDVGAYFTALGNNFAGPRLPVILIEQGKAMIARERETFESMVSRDRY
jgi:diaminopimelate decarboxylase